MRESQTFKVGLFGLGAGLMDGYLKYYVQYQKTIYPLRMGLVNTTGITTLKFLTTIN
jgi:hypothetical protein